jgi:hypothetical protein
MVNAARQSHEWTDKLMSINSFNHKAREAWHLSSIVMHQELMRIEKDHLIEIDELREKLELCQRELINANDALQKITEGKN